MGMLFEKIKKGGALITATNIQGYYEQALDAWNNLDGFVITKSRELNISDLFQPRTHFEKKYLERGESCYEIILQKQ